MANWGVAIARGLIWLWLFFQIFRRLKQDYPEEEVVKASILALILGITGYWLLTPWLTDIFIGLLAMVTVVYLFSLRAQWHFWAALERLTFPGLITLLAFRLLDLVSQFSRVGLLEAGTCLLTLVSGLYWRNYRRFSWYPSGKSGFLFLASLITLAGLNGLLDFWQGRLLELGEWSIVIALSLVFLLLLSERERRLDGQERFSKK